jgi:hypothetical protein
MRRIEDDYRAVVTRYGQDFRRRNAWAVPALLRRNPELKGAKIGFEHLQSAVNIQHWTPYHRMASHAIHPSATFFALTLEAEKVSQLSWPDRATLT